MKVDPTFIDFALTHSRRNRPRHGKGIRLSGGCPFSWFKRVRQEV
jgi:hypothetical protein